MTKSLPLKLPDPGVTSVMASGSVISNTLIPSSYLLPP